MCGFVGVVTEQEKVLDRIDPALATIRHRGPDGTGKWTTSNIALGHARLSVIDLDHRADQPMVDERAGFTIAYNGEIYNFRQLRASLLANETMQTNSDTEVILKLYQKFGADCVSHLRGMFAFAIWDQNKKELFLARDRFGIKPLFYHHDGENFYFASEIKAILALGVSAQPDLNTFYQYISGGKNFTDTHTFFANIYSLDAAECGVFRNGEFSKHTYWKLEKTDALSVASQSEAIDRVYDTLEDSLKMHMVSDIEVGISLSSGLDSFLLVNSLTHMGYTNLHSFTFGFDFEEYDEIRRSQQHAFRNIQQHTTRLQAKDFFSRLEQTTLHFEFPLGGLGNLSLIQLYELADEKNIRVLLTGEGADEIFAGYQYFYYRFFRDLLDAGKEEELKTELAAFNAAHGTSFTLDSDDFLNRLPPSVETLGEILAPDATKMNTGNLASAALLAAQTRQPAISKVHSLKERLQQDLGTLKIPKLLMFQDRQSMASGIETRVPFLDHVLVEYMFSLPSSWLMHASKGRSKGILRDFLQKKYGVQFHDLKKLYVNTPQREWLKDDLREPILKMMDEGLLRKSGLIQYDAWRREYLRYCSAKELGNSFFVWKMITLESLLQNYFADWQGL